MSLHFVTNERIAETSSKGNQEKWVEGNRWYKLDQFGYEALAETLISQLLELSNCEKDYPFRFTRYQMERITAHGIERTGCSSANFLLPEQSIITLSHLYKRESEVSLRDLLSRQSSDRKRIAYLADATAELTGLELFPQYLTLLFEVDALFLNDDRHLNNIAVLECDGKYDYCPIFDNGAGLLSNMRTAPMDIEPKALIAAQRARPFGTTFNRQAGAVRALYGKQMYLPKLSREDILKKTDTLLSQQETGILFVEVCVKECKPGGRIAIILPNGYLGNRSIKYRTVREWILRHTKLAAIVSLPRFTFKSSGADVSASVLYLEKRETPLEHIADSEEYQFAVELIEKVGWDAGNKKAAPVYKRDPEDGSLIIDEEGFPILDCDFDVAVNRILASDAANCFDWISKGKHVDPEVNGWSVNIKHIYDDPDLTIDPKRYSKKVVDLRSKLKTQPYVLLGDVVDFIPEKQNAYGKKITVQKSSIYQYVEIQDIGFGDFHCKEMRGWELPSRAKHFSSAGDIYIGAIWGSAIKWCYIPEGIDNVVVTNGCFRCRVKAGMEKFTPDLLAYLNSEGWGVQMRAFSRGSDGLAEICEDDAKNVIIPLLSDDVRDGLSEYVENLQRGTTTINSVVKQLIKDERIAYNDPDKRPSHIVIV